jgi:NAD(P)-dependent dehydrogenase (short-subunit alcohol dehydrogenase family)
MSPTPAYKVTKAAMNMLTVQYGLELGKDGFTLLAISPGARIIFYLLSSTRWSVLLTE